MPADPPRSMPKTKAAFIERSVGDQRCWPVLSCGIHMPTPEHQREYTRLSSQLQSMGQRYFKELPHGSVSLVLTVNQGNVLVEAYDRMGRKLGDIPNQWTSSAFRSELENEFGKVTLPDENITTMVSNPLRPSPT